jgi:hypothetical protein
MEINVCVWVDDSWEYDATVFDTGCNNRHKFIVGGIVDNDYKFCPYCGKRIKEVMPDRLPETYDCHIHGTGEGTDCPRC